ncbi:S-adenosyl-L-methionine-dependent methyltransferase [Cokeromyces recurvatus]|uniref:S-adenosyl-L-methionine-dependent methyltransferase n=1 Tax=Cokeromyces recurvatus TaxID=90255 RepID=UPI00221F8B11|nr:S-adenosyl-L-methionine-dependent methyltransferase [Cokeromyces recurvatus]KAI7902926.1 S-adenosyl-L-methionine-dependent methyltransferase [Cokeromyces recurvatus]
MLSTVIRSLSIRRHYTTAPFQVFDRHAKRLQRDRAALDVEQSRTVDYLRDTVAARVADRLLDVNRSFNTVVDLGSGCGHIIKHVKKEKMNKLIMCDMSEKALNRDINIPYEVQVERRVIDEEHLPFPENSLDAVVSSMSLNWVNDLPGTLIQIKKALKPDGVFIGAMLGGDTLFELRTSLQLAENERENGISPRISPMVESSNMSRLLSRAGFSLITVDVEDIQVNYPSAFELMQDLRAMGESNAVLTRQPFIKRDTLIAAAAIYKELHGNPDGTIPATFQIIYLIGWKPSENTPLPKKRGSATTSLKDVLES